MTQTTARPAQLAPVRIGKGVKVHLGHLSSIKGPNGEPRYCSWCPASAGRDGGPYTAGEAVAEAVDCRSCQRQAGAEPMERAAATAAAMTRAAEPAAPAADATLDEAVDHHDLDAESVRVLDVIPASGAAAPDDLAARARLDLRTVLHRLSLLELAGLVRRQQDGVARVVTLNREYDHNGQCVGCAAVRLPTVAGAADGEDYGCTSTCGFTTGAVSPAMILRAAVRHLERFGRGNGADVRAALDAAAVALVRTEDTRGAGEDLDVEDLVDSARDALGAYFGEVAGPDGIPGAELVEEYGVLVPRRTLAMTLRLAAARHDGADLPTITCERLLGEALRELESRVPHLENLVVHLGGPEGGPREVEFLGSVETDPLYDDCGWIDTADEDAFNRAGDLIVRALTTCLPPYLRATGDGNPTHRFAIADTTYGRTLRR